MVFDRAATVLLPMARIIRDAYPEHQQAIIRHIVEHVTIVAGQVIGITVQLEARPFFDDLSHRMAMAPPDGLEPPRSKASDPLDWYAGS